MREHREHTLGCRAVYMSYNCQQIPQPRSDTLFSLVVPKFRPSLPSLLSCPQNCSIADCQRFRCDIPSFGIQEELDFILKGNLSFHWVNQVRRHNSRALAQAQVVPDMSVPILNQARTFL